MKTMKLLLMTWVLANAAWAHPLGERALAVGEQADRLLQQMRAGEKELTWGQKMAAEDMDRLVQAAEVAAQVLTPDEVDWEGGRAALTEFQVAGNRVRMTLSVSNLDSEAQELAREVVAQVEEIESQARTERGRNFERRTAGSRPQIGFGLGFGNFFGSPWGYGFPGFYGMGFGRSRGWGRCR